MCSAVAHFASAPSAAEPRPTVAAARAGAGEDALSRNLRRGLQVLEAVVEAGSGGIRVVQLCRVCGLERATVYRLLAALVDCGYVTPSGRYAYVAGPKAEARAGTVRPDGGLLRLQKVLEQVSAACGDASFAVIRQGRDSLCVARQLGSYPVQVLSVQVGTRQPLGVGAAGLALLAALPPGQAGDIIDGNAPVLGTYGGMTPGRMRLLVAAARERGWSVIGNHAARGALGVGLAVYDRQQQVAAGISVPSAMERMPRLRQKLIVELMRQAVAQHLPHGL